MYKSNRKVFYLNVQNDIKLCFIMIAKMITDQSVFYIDDFLNYSHAATVLF